MHSIDSGDADCIDPQHENSISGHMGSHGNDRFHIAPDMTVPGHNQFSQGLIPGVNSVNCLFQGEPSLGV